ncbi:MAG: hypothetical protein AAFU66_10370 [Pseudomonadota bacterium]
MLRDELARGADRDVALGAARLDERGVARLDVRGAARETVPRELGATDRVEGATLRVRGCAVPPYARPRGSSTLCWVERDWGAAPLRLYRDVLRPFADGAGATDRGFVE